MKYYYDRYRHLICEPYSIENLHEMADLLGIKRHWFHNKPGLEHYDVPKHMLEKVAYWSTKITPKELLLKIQNK